MNSMAVNEFIARQYVRLWGLLPPPLLKIVSYVINMIFIFSLPVVIL